jgi:hypothetical protein
MATLSELEGGSGCWPPYRAPLTCGAQMLIGRGLFSA